MADNVHNTSSSVRCLSCGHVAPPGRVGPGPGWIALALWVAAAAFWVGSWYVLALVWGFWIALFAALAYTLWYFFRRERACRHCGGRRLEAGQGSSA